MPPNELSPGGRWAAVGCRCDVVAAQAIADGLVRQVMAQVSQRSHNSVVPLTRILAPETNHQRFHLGFRAAAARMSGFAVHATSFSFFRPSRLSISAGVQRSGSESRCRVGRCARRMRFSAAKYSFFSNNS